MKGHELYGKSYEQQLQRVILPKDTVMKILKTRGLGKDFQKYVLLYDGTEKWI